MNVDTKILQPGKKEKKKKKKRKNLTIKILNYHSFV